MSNQSTILDQEKKEKFSNFDFSQIKTYATRFHPGLSSDLFRTIGVVILEVGFLMTMLSGFNLWTGSTNEVTDDAFVVIESSESIVLSLDMGVATIITGCLIMILASDRIITDYFFKKN